MPASSLWSLLLEVLERRAKARSLPELTRQWEQDDFTAPAPIDQRTFMRVDARLLEAAADFEAVELSPLTPLGTCSVMALASQNKIVSALRGTEVLSDPTNALALECARRLRQDPEAVLRLATSQRVVRAQRLPPLAQRSGITRHFRQHFRMFVLTTAGREVKDHGFVVEALREHIHTHLRALDLLERDGYSFPGRALRLLATKERAPLLDRIAADCPSGVTVSCEVLNHPYYSGGLRFLLGFRAGELELPLIDGGAFDWVSRLSANRKHVFVASGLGSQLVAAMGTAGAPASR
ncbi:MAG TPA: hypothetical protein PLW65_14670 [Pseudomonadota bacterium]|nr:hypothetical protein [Pseudomonadota bacterium]